MKQTITIGRSRHCDIIVPNDSVSREHARMSIVGGNYVYEDVGKNGSVIGGRVIRGERIVVAPGAEILLAGRVPLPWAQIYAMLPLKGVRPYEGETHYEPSLGNTGGGRQYAPTPQESIGIGFGILAFLFPIVGWIMYFVWKDTKPRSASQANTLAWTGFAINMLLIITSI